LQLVHCHLLNGKDSEQRLRFGGSEPDVPRGTLLGDIVQVRPVDGETVAESATVPANPFTLVAVKVEPPAVPEFTVTPAGLALKAKSCKMKVKVPE